MVIFAAKRDREKKNNIEQSATRIKVKKDAVDIETVLKTGKIKNIGRKYRIDNIKLYNTSKAISEMKYFFNPKGKVASVSNVPCFISLVKLFSDFINIFVDISTRKTPAKMNDILSIE